MANTKISALTANTNPNGGEELVYAYNNANGKMTLNTMKAFVENNLTGYATTADLATKQDTLVSGTNIRTINGASVVGSGDIIVTGGTGYTAGTGIDITGGVISATGGGGVTELTADANIRELSEGAYVTEHELYYKTGEKIDKYSGNGYKQYINVIENSQGGKGFFVFNVGTAASSRARCSFGYTESSSVGAVSQIKERQAPLYIYEVAAGATQGFDGLGAPGMGATQVVSNVSGTEQISATAGALYSGVTYTLVATSVNLSDKPNVSVDGTTVTNPLNISLPSSASKPFVITLVATDDSHAIVTGYVEGQ